MNWITRIFAPKNEYKARYTLYDVVWHYIWAEREHNAMRGYIRENQSCGDMRMMASGKILKRRYGLDPSLVNGLAWYLLEQYFKGNIIIKNDEELQSVK